MGTAYRLMQRYRNNPRKKVYLPKTNQYRIIMENSKKIFWNKAMFWGFIIGLCSMIATSIFYATDNFESNARTWIDIAISVAGIIAAAAAFRNATDEKTPFAYSRALGLGVMTQFFASIILAVFTYILVKFIDPGIIDQALATAEEKLLDSGFDPDMIESQIEMQKKFMTPMFMAAAQIMNGLIFGLLISLITSIFMKRKSEEGFQKAMNEIDDEA